MALQKGLTHFKERICVLDLNDGSITVSRQDGKLKNVISAYNKAEYLLILPWVWLPDSGFWSEKIQIFLLRLRLV